MLSPFRLKLGPYFFGSSGRSTDDPDIPETELDPNQGDSPAAIAEV